MFTDIDDIYLIGNKFSSLPVSPHQTQQWQIKDKNVLKKKLYNR